MSRSAFFLLISNLLILAVLWFVPQLDPTITVLLKGVAAITGVGFVVALAIGRRYKFDPILR